MFEEPVCRAARDDGLPPGVYGQSGGGMERKGQQIKRHQDRGERFLAVPEIMFEIVHIGLEYVEGLVLHLPSCPSAWRQVRYRASRDR